MVITRLLLVLSVSLLLPATPVCTQWVYTNGPPLLITTLASNGTNLFAGTWEGGVFLTTDNGTTWTAVNSGLGDLNITALIIRDENLFAGTPAGVFLSTNQGTEWTSAGLANKGIGALVFLGFYLFAGGDTIFRSSDNGTTWIEANGGYPSPAGVTGFGVKNGNLFAGSGGRGIWMSSDGGMSWLERNAGLTYPFALTFATIDNNLFAGTGYRGVFLSTNDGGEWTETNQGLPSEPWVVALTFRGENLFAGTEDGVYLSTNNGPNWTAVNEALADTQVLSLAVHLDHLFAGTVVGIFRRPLDEVVSVPVCSEGIPGSFSMSQNYPNPFNPSTTISYAMRGHANVTLKIYNTLGQLVAALVEEPQTAGYKSVLWDGRNDSGTGVASGIYIYRMAAGGFTASKRMLLLK